MDSVYPGMHKAETTEYNSGMDITIRLSRPDDIAGYTALLQETYADAYVKPELGLTSSCFSREVFMSPDTQNYLASNLLQSDKQKTWLAFSGKTLVGSVTVMRRDTDCEMRGFYVKPDFQGKGIGKQLWKLAKAYAGRMDITCDIYAHNTKTIALYRRWGFVQDRERGDFFRHWPEWPEGVRARSIYMRSRNLP